MATGAPGTPTNFLVQTANQQVLVSWDQSVGSTSYTVQRSLDNITFADLATVSGDPLASSYLDTAVTLETQYWYKVIASNAEGDSLGTSAASAIPTPTGEMCLSQIRLASQQRADRVGSEFVTSSEWNSYINQAMFELYDLLVTVYEDYFIATPVQFTTDGTTTNYPLPNGTLEFDNGLNTNETLIGSPLYKIIGVDLSIQNTNNGYVTVNKFNFIDRNRFVYPNSSSTIYGVFNLQYRVLGQYIQFIPTPSANQAIRLWYIPRLTQLLQDTDTTITGISGWNEYIIVRAAKYALDKEEADTSKLDQQILFLKTRIEESASNRDAGQPDKISDTRSGSNLYGSGGGFNGPTGGW